ncbi:hypothetical protein [Actinacidiphila sp. bgisy167]|uniref:hypothetical protein n=1 Tax=Actinacidiphila sp. bgisy167 TaxID=3413797 RepID=UPI003D75B688
MLNIETQQCFPVGEDVAELSKMGSGDIQERVEAVRTLLAASYAKILQEVVSESAEIPESRSSDLGPQLRFDPQSASSDGQVVNSTGGRHGFEIPLGMTLSNGSVYDEPGPSVTLRKPANQLFSVPDGQQEPSALPVVGVRSPATSRVKNPHVDIQHVGSVTPVAENRATQAFLDVPRSAVAAAVYGDEMVADEPLFGDPEDEHSVRMAFTQTDATDALNQQNLQGRLSELTPGTAEHARVQAVLRTCGAPSESEIARNSSSALPNHSPRAQASVLTDPTPEATTLSRSHLDPAIDLYHTFNRRLRQKLDELAEGEVNVPTRPHVNADDVAALHQRVLTEYRNRLPRNTHELAGALVDIYLGRGLASLPGGAPSVNIGPAVRPANGWSPQTMGRCLERVMTRPVSVAVQNVQGTLTHEGAAALAQFVFGYAAELRLWHAYSDAAALPRVAVGAHQDFQAVAQSVASQVQGLLRSVLGPAVTQQIPVNTLLHIQSAPLPPDVVELRVDRPEIDTSPHPVQALEHLISTTLRGPSGVVRGRDFSGRSADSQFDGDFTAYPQVKGDRNNFVRVPVPWRAVAGGPYFVRAQLDSSGPGFIRVATQMGEQRLSYEHFGDLLAQDSALRAHPSIVLIIPDAAARNLDLARAVADRIKRPVWSHTGRPLLHQEGNRMSLVVLHGEYEPAGQWLYTAPHAGGQVRERPTVATFVADDGRLFLDSDLYLAPLADEQGRLIGHRSLAPNDPASHHYWPLSSFSSYRMGQLINDEDLLPVGPAWKVPWDSHGAYFFDSHSTDSTTAGQPILQTVHGRMPLTGKTVGSVLRRRRSFTERLASQAVCLVCEVGQTHHLADISQALRVETFGGTHSVSAGNSGFILESGGSWVRARNGMAQIVSQPSDQVSVSAIAAPSQRGREGSGWPTRQVPSSISATAPPGTTHRIRTEDHTGRVSPQTAVTGPSIRPIRPLIPPMPPGDHIDVLAPTTTKPTAPLTAEDDLYHEFNLRLNSPARQGIHTGQHHLSREDVALFLEHAKQRYPTRLPSNTRELAQEDAATGTTPPSQERTTGGPVSASTTTSPRLDTSEPASTRDRATTPQNPVHDPVQPLRQGPESHRYLLDASMLPPTGTPEYTEHVKAAAALLSAPAEQKTPPIVSIAPEHRTGPQATNRAIEFVNAVVHLPHTPASIQFDLGKDTTINICE